MGTPLSVSSKVFWAVGTVLIVDFCEANTCAFVYGSVLIEFSSTWYAITRHEFHVYLYFLSWMWCSFIRFGVAWISFFPSLVLPIYLLNETYSCMILNSWFSKTIPQHYHIIFLSWISTLYQFQSLLEMFFVMMVRTMTIFLYALPCSDISCYPVIDCLSAHMKSPWCLCYTFFIKNFTTRWRNRASCVILFIRQLLFDILFWWCLTLYHIGSCFSFFIINYPIVP